MSTKKELLEQIEAIDPKEAERLAKAKKVDIELWLELHDEEDETKGGMSKTLAKYRVNYQPSIAPSGRKSLNTGDKLATILAGMEPLAVIRLAEQVLGLEAGELLTKYEHLNRGQQRMNAGNRIRAAVKRGDITIEGVEDALKA